MALTKSQRKHLEGRLLEERSRLVRALDRYKQGSRATQTEGAGDVSSFPMHMADVGTDTADREFDAANAARQTLELAEIDAALNRLYNHPETFGLDERTGEPISFERLDIIPWARHNP
jgi:DnaK suppressor protein